jgi:hypothetical protein
VSGQERCPRCGGTFHCGAADPAPCACTTIDLDAALLAELRARYTGCLCLPCLRELARARMPDQISRGPGRASRSP